MKTNSSRRGETGGEGNPEFVILLRSPVIDSQPGGIDSWTEPVLLNVNGAPELMPRNEFRQPM
jgi:hypothetical protein